MRSHARRTSAATASSAPGSPRNAGPTSITGIVRVTSARSLTAIALKMFMARYDTTASFVGSSLSGARIEDVAQRIADQVERQHDDEDREPRQQHDVRAQDHEL